MKQLFTTVAFFLSLTLLNGTANAQANVLNPNDPDVIFTSTNQPALPPYGVISKWGHTNRLSWNPFSYGYKSYYFRGMAFRIKFPKSYQHNVVDGKTYPSLLFFHGLGEPGPVYDNEFHLVHGGQLHAQKVDDGTFDGFLIYPQSQGGYLQSYFPILKDLVDSLAKYVKLDIDRINVGGLSSGGQAAWDFCQQEQYAKLIAGLEVISAAQYEDVTYFASHITIPIIIANGGQDVAPYPSTVTDIINSYRNLGGNITQKFFPDQGHGAWNVFWADPDYWPFLNARHKANPLVYFQHYKFCPGETVSAKLGIQAGFDAYEWQKDGTTIAGEITNILNVTSFGSYKARFRRIAGGAWSSWSPTAAVISQNTVTVSPSITVLGMHSKVLPAPDGAVVVPLTVPNTYASYEWRRISDSALMGSTNTISAAVGQYKVKVTEQFGCGSDFSLPITVVPANGPNPPEAATSVAALAISNNSVQLDWNDNPAPAFNETGFEIYRSKTAGTGYALIAITGADVLSYLDQGLSANTKYFYIVRAVNNSAASPVSAEVNATTQTDINPPTAPNNLVITNSTRTSISLSWDAATDDVGVAKYEIYVNGVKTYLTANTTYTVNNLDALQTYSFFVKARDASGNVSPASNQVSGTAALRGLTYKYYEGQWNSLPDFNTLTPVAQGLVPNVSLAPRLSEINYSFLWEGYINIPVTGTYTFSTSSDDGSKLYIGTYSASATPLVNNDGLHGTQTASGTITLNAGVYPIAMTFFQLGGGAVMNIYWSSVEAGISSSTVIPNSAFTDIVTIPASSLPAKPSFLNVNATAYNRININWTDNSNNESGFELTRSTSLTGTYVNIGTTPANVTNFVDTVGLDANTIYFYKIKSVNQFGQSESVSTLEGRWSFNNDLNDGSGNNRILTASGGSTFSTDIKEGTYSLSLNGSDQYADMAFSSGSKFPSNAYTARTVAVWIKPTSATVSGTNKIVYEFGGSDNGLALRFNAGALQAGLASGNLFRYTAVVNSVTSNPKWIVNGWNNVIIVYNINSLKLYLNGTLMATTSLSISTVSSSPNSSRIGASNGSNAFNSASNNSNYGGLIDDVIILKEPVDANGVVGLMNQSYTADTTLNLPALPASPSNLISPSKTTSSISLQFDDNSTTETAFELYRSAANTTNFRLLATISGGAGATKSYTDANLFANSDYYYKVRAKAIGGTTAFTPTLLVRTADNPPVFNPVPNTTMRFSSQKVISVSATDVDGENLSFSFINPLPSFATFTNISNGVGSIQFNPTSADLGVYNISIKVQDGNLGSAVLNFTLTVNNNYTPVIVPVPNQTVLENSTTTIALSATDQDGNSTLVWSVGTAPSFVTLTDNGSGSASLKIAPNYANAGVYPVIFNVTDGAGATEQLKFVINVTNVEPTVEKWYISTKYTSANAPAPWNNVSSVSTNNLLNGSGQSTAVGLQFLGTNWNAGDAGAVTGNNSGVYPDAVIKDYFWFGAYGAPETVNVNLTGLTTTAKYNVTLFGSSAWTGLGNNGTTVYAINGIQKPLYVDNNKTNTVTFSSVSPDASGNITVNMSKGSATPYGVLNAMVLEKPFDDGSIPVSPTNLTAQALTNGTVRLDWKDIAYNETNYLVSRATNSAGPFTIINPGATNANDVSYIDNTVASSTTYYYKVQATNTAGASGFSNLVSVTTLNKAPLLANIADVNVKGGYTASVSFAGTDDVGDVLTTTIIGLPSFGTFQNTGNGAGTITLNPTSDNLGVYGVTVQITDNFGASVSKSFNVTVTDNSVRSAFLNFGPEGATPQPAPWNNYLGYPFSGYVYNGIKDDANVLSNFTWKFLDQWNGGQSVGMRTGNNTGVFPDNVMKTSFYNSNPGSHVMEFGGLNPSNLYSLGFLTDINTGANSTVTFTSAGQTVVIDGRYNTTVLGNLNGLTPDASGKIQVTITKDAANPVLMLNGVVIREYSVSDPVIRPSDLFAETLLQTDKIKLTWSDRSSTETGFEIYRSNSSNGSYSLVATTAANVTSYTNTGLAANSRYFYKVRAVQSGMFSSYSNTANAMVAEKIILINQNVNIAQKAPAPWNSTSAPSTLGATFSNLINTLSVNSGFEMVITKEFNGAGFAGVNANGIFPANVMVSNYWTDAGQTSQVKFQNLDVSKKYRIGCFGSNLNTNFSTANYTCNGKTVELNSYYNDMKVVYLDKLTPGPDGDLLLSVTTASGSPYSFTGAYTIEYYTDNTPEAGVTNTIYPDGIPANIVARNIRHGHVLPADLKPELGATSAKGQSPVANQLAYNVSVYPNPFTDFIQIDINRSISSKVVVMLYDVSGRVVFRSAALNTFPGRNLLKINLPTGPALLPGNYMVNILTDGRISKSVQMIKVN